MSELPNQEIEGRLIAQRETLVLLLAHLSHLDFGSGRKIIPQLETLADFQDFQEDPGAVLSGPSVAVEAAKMREIRLILQDVQARLDRLKE
ncbi:hypothetical protein [Chelativorans sp. Marseille-P2723]|uniref:hypothetical protein n=1 Tax=Chelativorans sp. Marseille-P2723 TaxID=2709133 RepID=UPI001570D160|nr:hypothetical protein [Chelativorans sp. Marseille-P2723]